MRAAVLEELLELEQRKEQQREDPEVEEVNPDDLDDPDDTLAEALTQAARKLQVRRSRTP